MLTAPAATSAVFAIAAAVFCSRSALQSATVRPASETAPFTAIVTLATSTTSPPLSPFASLNASTIFSSISSVTPPLTWSPDSSMPTLVCTFSGAFPPRSADTAPHADSLACAVHWRWSARRASVAPVSITSDVMMFIVLTPHSLLSASHVHVGSLLQAAWLVSSPHATPIAYTLVYKVHSCSALGGDESTPNMIPIATASSVEHTKSPLSSSCCHAQSPEQSFSSLSAHIMLKAINFVMGSSDFCNIASDATAASTVHIYSPDSSSHSHTHPSVESQADCDCVKPHSKPFAISSPMASLPVPYCAIQKKSTLHSRPSRLHVQLPVQSTSGLLAHSADIANMEVSPDSPPIIAKKLSPQFPRVHPSPQSSSVHMQSPVQSALGVEEHRAIVSAWLAIMLISAGMSAGHVAFMLDILSKAYVGWLPQSLLDQMHSPSCDAQSASSVSASQSTDEVTILRISYAFDFSCFRSFRAVSKAGMERSHRLSSGCQSQA
mmetsp:Transcript_6659/g.23533  ORF Transcript_6659/g.23533 Transcript_6659/m.23533 type:complete len:493 (+) Transcript_6659:559-2037(+)